MATRIRASGAKKRKIARYYVDNNSTMRETAVHFGVSKTYIHAALTEFQEDPGTRGSLLAIRVKELIDKNTVERAKRGGFSNRDNLRIKKK